MKRFKNILLLSDGDCWLNSALPRAVSLAKHNQANLTIISSMNIPKSVCHTTVMDCRKLIQHILDDRKKQLEEAVASMSPDLSVTIIVNEGRVFPEIIHNVLRDGYDLVMKCAETENSLHNRIFGIADMHILRKCPCPVWIMHSDENVKYKKIFAAVDVEDEHSDEIMSGLNEQILELASSLALSEFAELHIVHAWTAWGESFLSSPRFRLVDSGEVAEWVEQRRVDDKKKMNDLMEMLTETLSRKTIDYIKPQLHIIKGDAHTVIRDLVQEQQGDLLVMGTVARTGISGVIMGNTAESILESVGCSVLVVKPPGFVSPITL